MSEKILIVDDDVDSLKLIGLMLKRHGYDVVVADNGGKGLAKADAEAPQLIILDVMMPDMNGLEVCRRLRANPNTRDIPIIMFTAKTLIDDKVKGFEAGADDYLTKPTHPAELASRVKSILTRQTSQDSSAPEVPTPRRGTVIGVMGAKGGVGTTTVAVNLAASLRQTGEEPILADFRLGIGDLGLMLGANTPGIARVLTQSTINAASIQREMYTHSSGLRALVSHHTPREAQLVFPPENAATLLQQLRILGNATIVDLAHGWTALNQRLVKELDRLLFVVEANSVALEIANGHLRDIDAVIGSGRISVVVVNRSQSTLPWHQVENALGREVKAIISASPELAHQALENRVPMVLLQPGAMVSGQFSKLAQEVSQR